MNRTSNETHTALHLSWMLLAGFTGGMAEVIWVSLYAAMSPLQGSDIAREITVSTFGGPVAGVLAPGLGILIHFILSITIALAFVSVFWAPLMRRFGQAGVLCGAMTVLAAIWTLNFFVLLPAINPAFVALMPLSVTLTSKLLFGASLGTVLAVASNLRSPASEPTRGRFSRAGRVPAFEHRHG